MSDAEPSPDPAVRAPASADGGAPAVRFPVEVPGFEGSLEQLVLAAQRGDVDLGSVAIGDITGAFRERLAADPALDPREVADFLTLAGRLVGLKANRLLPDGPLGSEREEPSAAEVVDDAGRRLAEYRLFKAAADALLGEAAEQGIRSFASVVSPQIVPTERLVIPPERLASAFRRVLERLPEQPAIEVETVTFSVDEKAAELRRRLEEGRGLRFEEVFEAARSQLEAIAYFLALLELVRRGEADVRQAGPFGEIMVTARG